MSYDPPGWYVDAFEQQIPDLVAYARLGGQDAVQLANIFLDRSIRPGGGELTDSEHVESLALLVGLLLRRLASSAP